MLGEESPVILLCVQAFPKPEGFRPVNGRFSGKGLIGKPNPTIAQPARGGGALQYRGTEVRPTQRGTQDQRGGDRGHPRAAGTFLLLPLFIALRLQL